MARKNNLSIIIFSMVPHWWRPSAPIQAAGVKGRYKRDWKNSTPGLSLNEFYDLYTDPREQNGEMIEQFHVKSMFNRQRQRHELWIEKEDGR